MNLKPTNPKDLLAIKKIHFSTIPWNVIAKISLAMLEGARKYGRHNWRVAGVLASVYFDATMRHLTDWWEGNDLTPEGTHHIDNAIASLIVLRASIMQGNMKDDRPPKPPTWLEPVNQEAGQIIEKYPNAAKIHTEIDNE